MPTKITIETSKIVASRVFTDTAPPTVIGDRVADALENLQDLSSWTVSTPRPQDSR